jgi:hypothetical protein
MADIPTILIQRERDKAAGRARPVSVKQPDLPITVACREAGISRRTYYARRERGLSREEALRPGRRSTARPKPDPTVAAVLRAWR